MHARQHLDKKKLLQEVLQSQRKVSKAFQSMTYDHTLLSKASHDAFSQLLHACWDLLLVKLVCPPEEV